MEALRQIAEWPAEHAAAGVVVGGRREMRDGGPWQRTFPWASVTKVATALVALVAVDALGSDRVSCVVMLPISTPATRTVWPWPGVTACASESFASPSSRPSSG